MPAHETKTSSVGRRQGRALHEGDGEGHPAAHSCGQSSRARFSPTDVLSLLLDPGSVPPPRCSQPSRLQETRGRRVPREVPRESAAGDERSSAPARVAAPPCGGSEPPSSAERPRTRSPARSLPPTPPDAAVLATRPLRRGLALIPRKGSRCLQRLRTQSAWPHVCWPRPPASRRHPGSAGERRTTPLRCGSTAPGGYPSSAPDRAHR